MCAKIYAGTFVIFGKYNEGIKGKQKNQPPSVSRRRDLFVFRGKAFNRS